MIDSQPVQTFSPDATFVPFAEMVVSLVDKMKGFAVEVAYVSKPETDYADQMRDVIKEDPEANERTFEFDKAGNSGTMDFEWWLRG